MAVMHTKPVGSGGRPVGLPWIAAYREAISNNEWFVILRHPLVSGEKLEWNCPYGSQMCCAWQLSSRVLSLRKERRVNKSLALPLPRLGDRRK